MIALPSLREMDRESAVRIWLCVAATDMRCSFDRLAELARSVTGQDPLGSAARPSVSGAATWPRCSNPCTGG